MLTSSPDAPKVLKATPQQAAFVKELVEGNGDIVLVARAGTGKTSAILMGVDAYVAAFPDHEITVCAFAKPVQIEIDAKLKARGHSDWRKVQAATSHSMGFGLVRLVYKSVKVNDNKVRDLIRAQNNLFYNKYFSQVRELVHLAKLEGFGFFDDAQIGDTGAWYQLAEHYGINDLDDTSEMDRIIEAAQRIYRLSLDKTDEVDFDDMILFPLVHNIKVRYGRDLILLDEAQDTSRARRALIKKFLKLNGRLVAVGDDRQAIMGFAGASAQALEELIDELKPVILPLNVTWRCPKLVVAEAQTIVPDITAADTATDGVVKHVTELPKDLTATDAILCRNNAPLVDTAYALIRQGIACKVEGREIGTGLLKMVDRWTTVKSIGAFLDKLEDWRERECQKALAKGKEQKIDEINDRAETLKVICAAVRAKGTQSLDGVREFIRDLFADNVTGVLTLCSNHRAKGREWPRVMLLDFAKRRYSKWDKQPWQIRQADNLSYVAITRAMKELVYVN